MLPPFHRQSRCPRGAIRVCNVTTCRRALGFLFSASKQDKMEEGIWKVRNVACCDKTNDGEKADEKGCGKMIFAARHDTYLHVFSARALVSECVGVLVFASFPS